MKKYSLLSFSFIMLFLGCQSIPKIQIGDQVLQIFNTKVVLENGKPIKMVDKESISKTTIILVRHAEKEKDSKDPNLTSAGQKRANDLMGILKNIKLDHVFSTEYNRTQQTAQPTAQSQDLVIEKYNPRALEEFGNMLLNEYQGKTILVVGHSNTTPTLLNFCMKEKVVESIDESDYKNLFIVNITQPKEEKISKAILVKY